MRLKFYFFSILLNLSPFLVFALEFTPEGWDFEMVLGPEGQVMAKTRRCDSTAEVISGLTAWKKRLGEEVTQGSECKCGKKEIERETYEFFRERLYREHKVTALDLRAKSDLNWVMKRTCYQDLSGVMPDKFAELAKRQLIKDLDPNPFNNTIYEHSGINCFATAMEATGYLKTPRFVSQHEFTNFLKSPMCKEITDGKYRPGDIISYHRRATRHEDHTKRNGMPIHASVLVTDNLVFEKKGGHIDFPYQLAPFDEALQVTKGPVAVYRCKTRKDLLEAATEVPDFKEALQSIEEIENCYNGYYSTDLENPLMKTLFPFVRTNLEIVSALVEQKRSELLDPEKRKPFEGKELEYEYWMLLNARIRSMYDNLNYPLEFPNMHDYLSEINR